MQLALAYRARQAREWWSPSKKLRIKIHDLSWVKVNLNRGTRPSRWFMCDRITRPAILPAFGQFPNHFGLIQTKPNAHRERPRQLSSSVVKVGGFFAFEVFIPFLDTHPKCLSNFAFDKLELESSPLTVAMLDRKRPDVCWQVFVENSGKFGGIGKPIGYLKVRFSSRTQHSFIFFV